MTITGCSFIAGQEVFGNAGEFRAHNPASGAALSPGFAQVGSAEVQLAAAAAAACFDEFRSTTPEQRAVLLETVAEKLAAAKEEIVERAVAETGLTSQRLDGELNRTCNQLRLFAGELRRGDHQRVRIDRELADRQPTPRPDMRQRQVPLGPVVVFGASNFPLAFSVAGGDTASALAAGCPVIVKAHSSHAGTAELAGRAIRDAVAECHLPGGVFSMLLGPGAVIGQALAEHPAIKAIAFTGSQSAGIALMHTAAARTEPIPVFAEMSSINPVVVFESAATNRTADVASGFVASLTLGSGQFCTNPGLIFVPAAATELIETIAAKASAAAGQTMLSSGIYRAFEAGRDRVAALGATDLARGSVGSGENAPAPVVFSCSASHFLRTPHLQEEVFGAAAIVVGYEDLAQLAQCAESLQGQLTATMQIAAADEPAAKQLLPILERKAGRLIVNGWPTGVEVNQAIVHGGPFPATSNSQFTSVGAAAIERFQRPVCYQGFPEALLPAAVQDANPWHLPQREVPTP